MPKGKEKSVGVSGKELKKLLALCKKRDVAFAYCPGGDIKDDVWMMHRKRGGEVIAREARAASEGTKVAFGTAKLSGKLLSLTCEREIANVSKRLKKWLKAEKCPLNVKILDKDGKVLEEDIEDLPDDDFLADVSRKAALMRQRLEGLVATYPDIFEHVRGTGLMLGLKCKAPNADVVAAGFVQGVLTVPAADNVVRILPALNIEDADITAAVDKLDAAALQLRRDHA